MIVVQPMNFWGDMLGASGEKYMAFFLADLSTRILFSSA